MSTRVPPKRLLRHRDTIHPFALSLLFFRRFTSHLGGEYAFKSGLMMHDP